MTTRRYTAQFAAITLDLEQQLKGSSPCAIALVRWLLLRCKPGCAIEFELQEFADYSAIALRSRPLLVASHLAGISRRTARSPHH
jgi:hypothetical protein